MRLKEVIKVVVLIPQVMLKQVVILIDVFVNRSISAVINSPSKPVFPQALALNACYKYLFLKKEMSNQFPDVRKLVKFLK